MHHGTHGGQKLGTLDVAVCIMCAYIDACKHACLASMHTACAQAAIQVMQIQKDKKMIANVHACMHANIR